MECASATSIASLGFDKLLCLTDEEKSIAKRHRLKLINGLDYLSFESDIGTLQAQTISLSASALESIKLEPGLQADLKNDNVTLQIQDEKILQRLSSVLPLYLTGLKQWVLCQTKPLMKDGKRVFKTLDGDETFEDTGIPKLDKIAFDANLVVDDNEWSPWSATSTKRDSWATYSIAKVAVEKSRSRNTNPEVGYCLGFCPAPGDGIVILDFDSCRNPFTGETTQAWVGECIEMFQAAGAYVEVSPSNTGFRVFCLGKASQTGSSWKHLEIYGESQVGHSARFHSVTESGAFTNFDRNFQQELIDLHIQYLEGDQPESEFLEDAEDDEAISEIADLETVWRALEALPVEPYSFERGWWIKIGMILRHYGLNNNCLDEAFKLWVRFSKRCEEKFQSGACEKKWKGFKPRAKNPVTVGTLFKEAKQFGFNLFYSDPEKDFADVDVSDTTTEQTTTSTKSTLSVPSKNKQDAEKWEEPESLTPALLPVPEFEPDLLPEPMRTYVFDVSERIGCPPEYTAMVLIVVLASLVGRRLAVRPKQLDSWSEFLILRSLLVGSPGMKKSPPLTETIGLLRPLVESADFRYDLDSMNYEEQLGAYKNQLKQRRKTDDSTLSAQSTLSPPSKNMECEENKEDSETAPIMRIPAITNA